MIELARDLISQLSVITLNVAKDNFKGYLSSFSVSEASSSARLLMFPPGCFLPISGVADTLEAAVEAGAGLRLATCLCWRLFLRLGPAECDL